MQIVLTAEQESGPPPSVYLYHSCISRCASGCDSNRIPVFRMILSGHSSKQDVALHFTCHETKERKADHSTAMKLVKATKAQNTSQETLDTPVAVTQQMGKVLVNCKNTPGRVVSQVDRFEC